MHKSRIIYPDLILLYDWRLRAICDEINIPVVTVEMIIAVP
jgi:hypothetical protein